MNELVEQLDFYSNFHHSLQNKYQLLKEADLFLNGKAYTIDVTDVCIAATANALCINLHIFQKIGDNAVIVQQKSAFKETNRSIFLWYTWTPNTNHIADHYDVICDVEIPTMQVHTTTNTEEPIIIIDDDDHDDHVHNPLHHANTLQSELKQEPLQQSVEQDDFFEIQQCPKKSKPKGQKSYLNMGLFIGLQHEVVDGMPWKTIGNKIYVIKCSEDYWWDKQLINLKLTSRSFSAWNGYQTFTVNSFFLPLPCFWLG